MTIGFFRGVLMNNKILLTTGLLALVLAACVTINVYFPEAAAREAATEFISGVLNDPDAEVIDSSASDNTEPMARSGCSRLSRCRLQQRPLSVMPPCWPCLIC